MISCQSKYRFSMLSKLFRYWLPLQAVPCGCDVVGYFLHCDIRILCHDTVQRFERVFWQPALSPDQRFLSDVLQ